MTRVLFLNGDAAIKPDLSGAYFPFPGPAAYFRAKGVNTGDAFVLDAILKQVRISAASDIRFADAGRPELWPREAPDLAIIRGSNYLGRSLDLGHAVPLVERLKGPVVAIGVGAQAPSYGPLDLPAGSVRFWRAVAERSVSIGVRGAYSAEVLAGIGVRSVRVIGCPTFYRALRPALTLRAADPATARVGLTLNRYLARDYTGSFVKTHRQQRALLAAVARRTDSRLFAQGEREESVLGHLVARDRPALARRILRRFDLAEDAAAVDLVAGRMTSAFDADEWAARVGAEVDFMVGLRVHGNIVALQQGIPAVYFTYDSRIREMATLFQVPAIEVERFMPVDLQQIIAAADFAPFERAYRENYREYRRFLDENGVPHRLPPAAPANGAAVPAGLNRVPLRFSAVQLVSWLQQEVEHLSGMLDAQHRLAAARGEPSRPATTGSG